ncbi:COP9 signalosome complex subunit 7 [Camellia lanceoleosa]|uniref:COP9 signalosome complex subunit 7 n=1 Tax=Camellia lanceoleosa TaxID=1840588 RepID=A0ACC0IHV0_9ERIC|nr:COP9 signalosome complex subunit 7 [Camellia lanceoleosa]
MAIAGDMRMAAAGNAGCVLQLVPDQTLKLKQLIVLTLAEANKVLPYDILMQELDVTNVREPEDFLINECMSLKVYIRLERFVHCLDANATH